VGPRLHLDSEKLSQQDFDSASGGIESFVRVQCTSRVTVAIEIGFAQTHSFKKSAPLLDPGPCQWPYQTQSSAYRGLRARYLLVSTVLLAAVRSTIIYYYNLLLYGIRSSTAPLAISRRLCLIMTTIKPQRPTFCHHHKGVARAGRPPFLLA
jgi:hypothetical protein